jgi:hypothetical protein
MARDNVAVVVRSVPKGEKVSVTDSQGLCLTSNEEIPVSHKIALAPIPIGGRIMRYGEVIGIATKTIRPGDWIHIHNMTLPKVG